MSAVGNPYSFGQPDDRAMYDYCAELDHEIITNEAELYSLRLQVEKLSYSVAAKKRVLEAAKGLLP